MKKSILLSMAAFLAVGASAQQYQEGDIQWLSATDFTANVNKFATDHQLNEDDNFYVSRVRPKLRFRNTATQVHEELQEGVNDRRLIAWIPFNFHNGAADQLDSRDAHPSGVFDSEVFSMWSYVDHWGDWTAPLGQVPAGFADVAHKNGVAVSSTGQPAFGAISDAWKAALTEMGTLNTTAGAEKAAKMLKYFGCDGIGYNSEFSGAGTAILRNLRTFHEYLHKAIKAEYEKDVPGYNMQEIVWYDGTNDNGSITFDNGLGSHNYQTWGPLGQERTSLFLNYNWTSLLNKCVTNAAASNLGKGRSALYLYAGMNMQGGEPSAARTPWSKLKEENISIGLWGQHKVNLFFEGRGSHGTTPEAQQATYQARIENWFTGGSHNPISAPTDLTKSPVTCTTGDTQFPGIATYMTARSTLSWDLSKEAFISYFNLGNGKFFNWMGQRQNDIDWYNISAQDYMPTWRWWWTNKFLGKTAADAATDLTAAMTWNDAYVGGSTIRITGSTSKDNYLHLFKTKYELKAGDEITFVYKLAAGSTDAALAFSVEGTEATVAKTLDVCESSRISDDSEWVKTTYTVASGDGLAGKTLAMVALKFNNASNADFYLGEFSIKRGTLATPAKPEITSVKVLRNAATGIDAKVYFKMANNKAAGEVCYNDEVNTSFFKIWSQEEGKEPVFMGITTSWAAILYKTPFVGDETGSGKIRFGVEAVSMDHNTSSDIAWSAYTNSGEHTYTDQVTVDKTTITPGEEFTLTAVDPNRSFVYEIWTAGDNSTKVASSEESANSFTFDGLDEIGTYDVKCIGANNTEESSVTFRNLVVVTPESAGRLPEILSITANDSETDIDVERLEDVTLAYTGRSANGVASRGIQLDEKFFGVKASEIMSGQYESFSIAGWLKINSMSGKCEWIDVRNHTGAWPRNNWGWLWTNLNEDGTLMDFHQELSVANSGAITDVLVYDFNNGKTTLFNPGQWTHFAFTFERNSSTSRTIIYINGKKVESKWFRYASTGDDFIADPYNTTKKPAETGTTDDYVNKAKALDLESTISIGGSRHTGRGGGLGFSGVLDDFQIWGKAMTQEEVEQSMAGLDANNLPAGVLAYFDFEDEPDSNSYFYAKGSKAGAKGSYYKLENDANAGEGQGKPVNLNPTFTSGCPFLTGVDYKIETKPTWTINKATISNVTGNDQEGSATAMFPLDGDYTANLTLKNDLGSDTKSFQFIHVGTAAGIEDVVADGDELKTYTVDDVLYLEVAEDGIYGVDVYGVNGQLSASKTQKVPAGYVMKLTLNGASGVYLVNVTEGGKVVKSFKVVKK
ncbi:MAG: T9SS type A sorting domain-containing protein [Bacteroides sp.]|nr:T9SS type A sorting domain-containing protein [Bacteroides sp.]